MTIAIGQWVKRQRLTVAHLVESVVADDAVVRCGRRLRDEPNSRGPLVEAWIWTPKCAQCMPATETPG
jgi:hypothetical protein